jgi:hypothetical protein
MPCYGTHEKPCPLCRMTMSDRKEVTEHDICTTLPEELNVYQLMAVIRELRERAYQKQLRVQELEKSILRLDGRGIVSMVAINRVAPGLSLMQQKKLRDELSRLRSSDETGQG